jgi:hypothetical protein
MGEVGGSGTGTGELDGALSALAARVGEVARLLDAAATVSGGRLAEGAGAYEQTDGSQFSGGASSA